MAVNAPPAGDDTLWHALPTDDVLRRFSTSVDKGLDGQEAQSRLQKYGPNRLPEGKKRGPFVRFLGQFNNILVYVLLGAGFVKLMLGLWLDAGIILGVVVLNALLGFIQEGKAEKALDSIRNMLSAEARTVRGGKTRMIPAEDLVPGDVVLLESGDKVPADLRLVDVKNLRTEEAALTGESVPGGQVHRAGRREGHRRRPRQHGVLGHAWSSPAARPAWSSRPAATPSSAGSTSCSPASARSRRRSCARSRSSATPSPPSSGSSAFWSSPTAAGCMGMDVRRAVPGGRRHRGVADPEGLPALITITLAIGVQRMAQRNAIIRRLPAVETLGSVSRICSDKTGTLTLMEMMVVSGGHRRGRIPGQPATAMRPRARSSKDGKPAGEDPVLELLGRVSLLCNDAELFQAGGRRGRSRAIRPRARSIRSRPSSAWSGEAEQAAYPRIDAIPFESEHKFMATLHKAADGKEVLFVKGAPEVILASTATGSRLADGTTAPIDRDHFQKASDKLAGQGERVLGLAWLESPGVKAGSLGPADLPKNLVLLGLIGLARSTAQGGDRGGEGVPRRRHPRDDDHRRPQDHRRGDRQDARHRRRQDRQSPAPRSRR